MVSGVWSPVDSGLWFEKQLGTAKGFFKGTKLSDKEKIKHSTHNLLLYR